MLQGPCARLLGGCGWLWESVLYRTLSYFICTLSVRDLYFICTRSVRDLYYIAAYIGLYRRVHRTKSVLYRRVHRAYIRIPGRTHPPLLARRAGGVFPVSHYPSILISPAALLVLLAAAARAGRIRLGLLPPGRPGQCLARVVADDPVDSSQGLGCVGVPLCRRQRVEPPGLLVVLGDACSLFVTSLKG